MTMILVLLQDARGGSGQGRPAGGWTAGYPRGLPTQAHDQGLAPQAPSGAHLALMQVRA